MSEHDGEALSTVKRALRAVHSLKEENAALRSRRHRPLAVVGMSCRLPGGASTPDAYWEMLIEGKDALGDLPEGRWPGAQGRQSKDEPGTFYCGRGGFITGVDEFDPGFFGIAPREAKEMDPQQRLMLEAVWHAMEDASLPLSSLREGRAGVFLGIGSDDYGREIMPASSKERMSGYGALGTARSVAAGRIAYALGLTGPVISLDTACSSALVAIHQAAMSLRNDECDLAIAGGVSLLLSADPSIALSRLQALSPSEDIRPFSEAADGYVRGEGCGAVLLKRLEDAERDADRILAVIRGTAIGHDGRSNGLTAPSGPQQERVMRAALADAGLAPEDIGYIEAHGTGTPLGDPIEIVSVAKAYPRAPGAEPLRIGSVKSNIGHLEAAAGMAAFIKCVLTLRHGIVPPTLKAQPLSKKVDWRRLGVLPADAACPLPKGADGKRRAAASAFGLSGTNAHVVLEDYTAPVIAEHPADGPHLVAISAESKDALEKLGAHYLDEMAVRDRAGFAALCRASRQARTPLSLRVAAAGQEAAAVADALRHKLEAPSRRRTGGLAFVFPGQGAQYAGMGQGLTARFPSFAKTVERCDEIFADLTGRDLKGVMWGEENGLLSETRYTQPALFAVEIATGRLLMEWGLEPDLLLGHSIGEYSAACLAGVFSLEDGMRLVTERGRLMADTAEGAMLVVFAGRQEIDDLLTDGHVGLAAANGPENHVLAGTKDAIAAAEAALALKDIRSRRLAVTRAFHSPLMEPMLGAYEKVVRSIELRTPNIPILSNVTGKAVGDRLAEPSYWTEHIRRPVLFAKGAEKLAEAAIGKVIEAGPGRGSLSMISAVLGGKNGTGEPLFLGHIMDRSTEEAESAAHLAGHLFEAGENIDWAAFDGIADRSAGATLPPYPFERQRYWMSPPKNSSSGRSSTTLPGLRVELARGEAEIFELAPDADHPVLSGHQVGGAVVVPAAAYIDWALAAAERVCGGGAAIVLEDVEFEEALSLADDEPTIMQLTLDPAVKPGGSRAMTVHARSANGKGEASWHEHARCRLATAEAVLQERVDLAELSADCPDIVSVDALYGALVASGLRYGGGFRSIREVVAADGRAFGRVTLTSEAAGQPFSRAALIDNGFQLTAAALAKGEDIPLYLPLKAKTVKVFGALEDSAWVRVDVKGRGRIITAQLTFLSEDGVRLAEIGKLALIRVSQDLFAAKRKEVPLIATEWREAPWPAGPAGSGIDLVVSGGAEAIGHMPALIRPDKESAIRAIKDAAAGGAVRIVYAAATDHGGPEAAIEAFLPFWQAVTSLRDDIAISVLFLTQYGAVTAEDDAPKIDESQAGLPSFFASLINEAPDLRLVHLDTEDFSTALSDQGRLGALLALAQGRLHVSRGQELLEPRLVPGSWPGKTDAVSIRSDASYLVTGGLGALGLEVAAYLAAEGAGGVALLSRRVPDEETMEAIRSRLDAAAGKHSVAIRFISADIASQDATHSAVEEWAVMGGLSPRGIFHAAGVLEDGVFETADQEKIDRTLKAKIAGLRHLSSSIDSLRLDLDIFSAFSSVGASMASPGQTLYAAGNGFMDAMMRKRRAAGLPGQSINWGAWSVGGMEKGLGKRFKSLGMTAFTPKGGIALLDRALKAGVAGGTLCDMDGAAFAKAVAHFPTASLFAAFDTSGGAGRVGGASGLREAAEGLGTLEADERRALLLVKLTHELASILESTAATIDPDRPLMDFGIDSLMALELRNEVKTALGVDVSMVRLLEGASVRALADMIAAAIEAKSGEQGAKGPEAPKPDEQGAILTASAEASFDREMESGEI